MQTRLIAAKTAPWSSSNLPVEGHGLLRGLLPKTILAFEAQIRSLIRGLQSFSFPPAPSEAGALGEKGFLEESVSWSRLFLGGQSFPETTTSHIPLNFSWFQAQAGNCPNYLIHRQNNRLCSPSINWVRFCTSGNIISRKTEIQAFTQSSPSPDAIAFLISWLWRNTFLLGKAPCFPLQGL